MTASAGRVANVSFHPTSLSLETALQRIRSRLGDWPAPAEPWRFRLVAPDSVPPDLASDLSRDVVVLTSDVPDGRTIRGWLARGASILDVSGDLTLLFIGNTQYPLDGERRAHWLAALAAFVDCGFALHDALTLAMAWRDPEAVVASPPSTAVGASADPAVVGGIAGDPARAVRIAGAHWPSTLIDFPRIPGLAERAPSVPAFPRCPPRLGLYPVVPDADWVERLIAAGVQTIQLRCKSNDPVRIREQVERAVAAARAAPDEIRLFINDHWQMAIEAGAYGVHLGQEDLQEANCAAIATAGLRLGLSTHGYYEIVHALHFRPSYIACGAIFPTATKNVATAPQGLARLAEYVRLLQDVVPVVAIGGIDRHRLAAVSATGVAGAAVVSAVTGQGGSMPHSARPAENDLKQLLATLQSAFNA